MSEPEQCQECTAPAVHEIRPVGPLEQMLWVRTCNDHVGRVIASMRRNGWTAAFVLEPGLINDILRELSEQETL